MSIAMPSIRQLDISEEQTNRGEFYRKLRKLSGYYCLDARQIKNTDGNIDMTDGKNVGVAVLKSTPEYYSTFCSSLENLMVFQPISENERCSKLYVIEQNGDLYETGFYLVSHENEFGGCYSVETEAGLNRIIEEQSVFSELRNKFGAFLRSVLK